MNNPEETGEITPRPNPGSDEAIAIGCLCPVLDNGHGRHAPFVGADGKPEWWVRGDCPVHVPGGYDWSQAGHEADQS